MRFLPQRGRSAKQPRGSQRHSGYPRQRGESLDRRDNAPPVLQLPENGQAFDEQAVGLRAVSLFPGNEREVLE